MVLCKLLIYLLFHPSFDTEIRCGKTDAQKGKPFSQLIVVQKALIVLVHASLIYFSNTS